MAVTTYEQMWKSEAIGYALLTAEAMGMSKEQLEELAARMEDHIQHTSRELAQGEYYGLENK